MHVFYVHAMFLTTKQFNACVVFCMCLMAKTLFLWWEIWVRSFFFARLVFTYTWPFYLVISSLMKVSICNTNNSGPHSWR